MENETKLRLRTGILLGNAVALVLLLSHIHGVIVAVTVFLIGESFWELFRCMVEKRPGWIILFCLLLMTAVCIPAEQYQTVITWTFPLGILLFGWLMTRVGRDRQVSISASVLIFLVVMLFFRALPELRGSEHGFYLLTATVLIGSATDTGAYFFGKRFGRRKLAPVISPRKTVEGAIGGTVSAFVILMPAAWFCEQAGCFAVQYPSFALYILLASAAGQFGDLAMSALKRIVGIKDFADLFPGHGGVLDRFDSLLFIAPFTCCFCSVFGDLFL